MMVIATTNYTHPHLCSIVNLIKYINCFCKMQWIDVLRRSPITLIIYVCREGALDLGDLPNEFGRKKTF